MMESNPFLKNLNFGQEKAVLTTEGPVMILAGAGSGKTRTLVSRITYLLEGLNISPFKILALTFSNKAAKEMRDRVSRDVASDIGSLQITTFHAFCAKVLRNEAQYLGLGKNFTIYDTSESKSIAKGILARRGVLERETSPFEILYYVSELKNNGHYLDRKNSGDESSIDKNDLFYDYFLEYESELHKSNAVDFGGLITGVIQLFEKFPEVLARYQMRFLYVLVDEYQDTNRAQFELITMLVAKSRNLCVVGDEDQSIYSWRGADIRNILNFEDTYSDAIILRLEQNYRSSKNIIEAASAVISRNTQRKGKNLWTENPQGESILIVECHSDKDEAQFVTDEIVKLCSLNIPLSEMAIFYRTNSQSRLIEEGLRRANLPYRVVGGVKFYDRKEIKDLLAYIRVVTNEKDSLAFSRVINVPARGIGATTLRKLENEALASGLSLWELALQLAYHSEDYKHLKLSARVQSSMRNFVDLISEVKVLDKNGGKSSECYDKLLTESGYLEYLVNQRDYESQARVENLGELSSAIKQYEDSQTGPTLQGFLERVTLDTSENMEQEDEAGEVSLMTIHGAKGLEFQYVFVTGIEENIFPSYQSIESGEIGVEEERRLFYVAMTRAMEQLYLTFAQGRVQFGQLKFNGHSRFIDEIPSEFYVWKKSSGEREKIPSSIKRSGDFDEFSQLEYEDEEVYEVRVKAEKKILARPESKFSKGTKVVHSLYGKGKVLDSEGIGPEEKVVVLFPDGVRKKFLVKFAPLTAIS